MDDATHPLIRRLESIADLLPAEKEALHHLPMTVREVSADQDIVREGDHPAECCLIVTGMACRYKVSDEGKRQTLSFHIAGEMPDLQSLYLKTMDHSLAALTRCRLAFIAHPALRNLLRHHPHLAEVFWRETLIDAAIFREWIMNIGQRQGGSRMAHLLCELYLRHKAVGLVQDRAFEFPITQADLGDATGFTPVHVNRVLQELRKRDLISLKGRVLTILNWAGLKELAAFDPTYLHQRPDDEAA